MRICVVVDINTVFNVEDNGYTRSMTLPEVENWARDKINTLTVLIKEGGMAPKPVRASFDIREVRFTPDKADASS